MGNARKTTKKMTSRTRGKRKKEASVPHLEDPHHIRAIVSTFAISKLMNLASNHAKICPNANFTVDGHNPKLFNIKCLTCRQNFKGRKDSEETHGLTISDAIATGALCSGIGYATVKTLFNSLEIPCIAQDTYILSEERIGTKLEEVVSADFENNGKEEKTLALEAGDVLQIGGITYPFIKVTVDGGWAKRSYGHSYKSNAGVAVIIGT